MNAIAALIVLAALGGQAPPGQVQTGHAQTAPFEARSARAQMLLAQAGTPPPGPMSPPTVAAPAPTPKIDSLPDGPPLGSLSLSQLVLKVEGEPEFAYVADIAWRDGKYAVTYVTRDGQSHEKMLDPRTGRESGRSTQTGGTGGDAGGGAAGARAGNTGGPNGPVMNPPALNPTGTPSNAPTTAPRPAGPRR